MDSGNSCSLQSSDDQEFDSIPESISSFLTHNPNPCPTLTTSFFDPSFFPHSIPVFDPVWSPNIPPGPTPTPNPNFTSFNPAQNDDVFVNSKQGLFTNSNSNQSSAVSSSNANMDRGSEHHQIGVSIKNPKKRTRASRRAPTTVLTTDATNFRQMVQEFTGIPATPFTAAAAASSPYARHLDIFSGGGLGPLYPIRPLKIQPVDDSSSSFNLPPSNIKDLQNQSQGLVNMQNPLFSFQSLLQTKLPHQVNIHGPMLRGSATQGDENLSGFASSSTTRNGVNDNLVNLEGVNSDTLKVDGFKVNSVDFDQQIENVVSTRNSGDRITKEMRMK
ncbi:uncharacterized protein [Rutidosis leptorrhynchoides]|uniref:uncharacterized protein n=1 Tax=Rutidosis leptorrhynchoides TaxID=125765 RepID=UPI003A9914F9